MLVNVFKKSTLKTSLVLAALAVTVSACGFHLRGSVPLPDGIKNMFVEVPKGSFRDELEKIITNAGGEINRGRNSANAILIITEARSERNVGTLDERGKVDSYDLDFIVEYVLEDSEGNQLRDASLTETRRYNFDPVQVIESESEEADLLEDMERDIALRIVRQLSTVTDLDYAPGG